MADYMERTTKKIAEKLKLFDGIKKSEDADKALLGEGNGEMMGDSTNM